MNEELTCVTNLYLSAFDFVALCFFLNCHLKKLCFKFLKLT